MTYKANPDWPATTFVSGIGFLMVGWANEHGFTVLAPAWDRAVVANIAYGVGACLVVVGLIGFCVHLVKRWKG